MKFKDIQAAQTIFLDANPLVYYFAPDPVHGPACSELISRIENGEIAASTSTHVLSEAAHHLMTLEASAMFGWPSKIVARLKQHPTQIQKLTAFSQAIEKVPQLGIQILTIPAEMVATAAAVSLQYGLLSNDALIVALMQAHGLRNLASSDSDFDRVPAIVRYTP